MENKFKSFLKRLFFFTEKKESISFTNTVLLENIENAIDIANAKHENCLDLCYELPKEVLDTLSERGYQISVHEVSDYKNCKDYEEFPCGVSFEGTPFVYKKTKICW
jgi:hypothetical protein